MAVQTTRDPRYDYYSQGTLFLNWSWYFRTFPGEKPATIYAAENVGGSLWKEYAGRPRYAAREATSMLACIHYRLGDLKPTQQIVINSAMAQSPQAFKVGMLLTPDFHAKVNWGRGVASDPMPQYLKGAVTELAKNSFGDRQITLLHERGLEGYLIPNRMHLQFISAGPDEDGDASGVFLFSFPF